jgi:putative endopeptidase
MKTLLCSLLLLLSIPSALFAQTPKPSEKPLQSLPYTPSLDINAMDTTADACIDFYQYTCGGWMKSNPIPGDQASWSVYGKMESENEQFLWGILEDSARLNAKRTAAQQKIGDYFAACMNANAVEKAGMTPLIPTIEEIAGLKSTADIPAFLAGEFYSDSILFAFTSGQDFADAEKVIAFIYAEGLGLPDRDYYLKTDPKSEELRKKYLEHVQRVFELLGDAPREATQEAQIVMSMETELAKASLTLVEKRNPHNLDHKMTRDQLQKLTPDFDWSIYLNTSGDGEVKIFNITEPKFFEQLNVELKSHPLSDWKTYLRWHATSAKSPYMSSKFVEEDFNFNRKALRGVVEQQPRWKKCVQWVDRDLGEALGQEFVRRTFTPEMKQKTLLMTKQVEQAMDEDIKALPWMSPETKRQALAKLHGIRNKVGYPDKWRNYSALEIKSSDFYGNVERSTTFEFKRRLSKIGKPLDRGEWSMTPPTVNAYYDSQMNDINFPAGVLQPPLYDPKMDDAPNYGNTGATIGHELTHGFDDEGREYDARGNLRDWWTKEDAEKFNDRVQCVKDQYKEYIVVDDIHINSELTAGEDVADLGGTILAYMAWKKEIEGKRLEPIQGFTPDQRFFIGMAQWVCNNERPENLRLRAATDPHSPGKYRINGVVSNMPEFQKAFNCKPGQPMVREKACRVW